MSRSGDRLMVSAFGRCLTCESPTLKDGYLDLSDITTTPATPSEIQTLKLRKGDLLLTEGGDPDKLGRGALWDEQISECIHQNHIFRVRLNRDLIEPA